MFDSFRGAVMRHVCTATCTSPPCSKSNISSKPLVRQGRFGKVGFTRLLSRRGCSCRNA